MTEEEIAANMEIEEKIVEKLVNMREEQEQVERVKVEMKWRVEEGEAVFHLVREDWVHESMVQNTLLGEGPYTM